jgi:hypothetical protein
VITLAAQVVTNIGTACSRSPCLQPAKRARLRGG